jgi:hypothetical protein
VGPPLGLLVKTRSSGMLDIEVSMRRRNWVVFFGREIGKLYWLKRGLNLGVKVIAGLKSKWRSLRKKHDFKSNLLILVESYSSIDRDTIGCP